MKEIRNRTHKPLRVPLPQGKTLHLGPDQTGQVPANALEHPPFQKLVQAEEIEVLGEGHVDLPHPVKEAKGPRVGGPARQSVGGVHPSGDR